jgi:HTH-type transcriptional regulator/antitoxin HigA
MLALKSEALTRSFLGFASKATKILHIETQNDFEDALELIEHLFTQAKDSADDPLNDFINMISNAIEEYESKQEDIINFTKKANNISQESSVLRVLISQHMLTLSDFKNEIGSKSLVSMILSGKRNLTKAHIAKLAKRFDLSPAIFFEARAR